MVEAAGVLRDERSQRRAGLLVLAPHEPLQDLAQPLLVERPGLALEVAGLGDPPQDALRARGGLVQCLYIHIYIYRERERER